MARTSVVPTPADPESGGATILPGVPLPLWGRPEEPVLPDPPAAAPVAAALVTVGAAAAAPPAPEAPPSALPPAPPPSFAAAAPVTGPFQAPSADTGLPASLVTTAQADPAPPEAAVVAHGHTRAPRRILGRRRTAEAPAPEAPEAAEPPAAVGLPDAPEAPAVPAPWSAGPEVAVGPEPMTIDADAVHDEPVLDEPEHEPGHDEPVHHEPEPGHADVVLDEPVPMLAPPAPVAPMAAAYAAAGAAPPSAPWGTPPAPVPAPVGLEPGDLETTDIDAATVEPADEPGPDDDRPERSRRPMALLGVLGGVAILGAVAAFVWPGFLVAADDPAPAPIVRPQTTVSAPVTLQIPQTAAGLSLLPGAPARALATAAAATILAGYTSPVSGVYGTGSAPAATVIAWTAKTPGTAADVSTAFAGYASATGKPVTGVTAVPTGTLGGQLSCGTGVVGTAPASVCFWSDAGSFGAITVLAPTSAPAGAATATAIRTAVETRG